MKKIILSAISLASILFFYSCNGSGDKSATKDSTASANGTDSSAKKTKGKKSIAYITDTCPGSGTYYVRDGEADTMIKNFKTIFPKFANWQPIHIDKSILLALGQVLSDRDTLDGVRFESAINVGNVATFALIPTKVINGCTDHRGLTCHENVYGEVFPMPTGDLDFIVFNLRKGERDTKTNNFCRRYRGETTPGDHSTATVRNLSVSAWVCKEVLLEIKQDLENEDIDGINIYFAAYTEKTVPSQEYDQQSTIVIVPTLGENESLTKEKKTYKTVNNHQRKRGFIESKANFVKSKKYNHSQLCPNACSEEGKVAKNTKK